MNRCGRFESSFRDLFREESVKTGLRKRLHTVIYDSGVMRLINCINIYYSMLNTWMGFGQSANPDEIAADADMDTLTCSSFLMDCTSLSVKADISALSL